MNCRSNYTHIVFPRLVNCLPLESVPDVIEIDYSAVKELCIPFGWETARALTIISVLMKCMVAGKERGWSSNVEDVLLLKSLWPLMVPLMRNDVSQLQIKHPANFGKRSNVQPVDSTLRFPNGRQT